MPGKASILSAVSDTSEIVWRRDSALNLRGQSGLKAASTFAGTACGY
jgi:hypothetical protein